MTFWKINWLRSAKRTAIRFLQLPCREKVLLVKAMAILLTLRIALCALPFRTLYRSVAERRTSFKSGKPSASEEGIIWAVRTASRLVPRASCLTLAMAAQILLSESGYRSDLRIGVARSGTDPLKAHAWLEKDGRVILGGPMCDYKPLSLEGL